VHIEPSVILIAFVVMTVGATVQGVLGFGANLLAVPVLVLIDPSFVPAPVIVAAITLNLMVANQNRSDDPWRRIRWPIAGQIVGTITGVVVIGAVASDRLAVLFGVLVLLAVALSASGLHPRRSRSSLVVGGAASGFMGTTVGIGGPPIALVYQDAQGPELRSSLARFFLVGSGLALVGLTIAGRFTATDLLRAAALVPGNIVGFRLSRSLVDRVDHAQLRSAVLVMSALSALAAIARAVLL
jgi:uncharacterized membrane protein YfcA